MKRSATLVLVLAAVLAITGSVLLWKQSNSGENLLKKADLALEAKKFDLAIIRAEKYLETTGNNPQPYMIIAEAYTRLSRYDEAEKQLKQAAELAADANALEIMRGDIALGRASALRVKDTLADQLHATELIKAADGHYSSAIYSDRARTIGVLAKRASASGQAIFFWSQIAAMLQRDSQAISARRSEQRLSIQWDNYFGDLPQWRRQTAKQLLNMSIRAKSSSDTKLSDITFLANLCERILAASSDDQLTLQAQVALADLIMRKEFISVLNNPADISPEVCDRVWAITGEVLEKDAQNPPALALRARVAIFRQLHCMALRGKMLLQLVKLAPDNKDLTLTATILARDSLDPDFMPDLIESFGSVDKATAEVAEIIFKYRLSGLRRSFPPGDVYRQAVEQLAAELDGLTANEDFSDKLSLKVLSGELALEMRDYDKVQQVVTALAEAQGKSKISARLSRLQTELKIHESGIENSETEILRLRANNPSMPEALLLQARFALKSDNEALLDQTIRDLSGVAAQSDLLGRHELRDLHCDIAELAIDRGDYDLGEYQAKYAAETEASHARANLLAHMARAFANSDDPVLLQRFSLAANGSDYAPRVIELVEKVSADKLKQIKNYATEVNVLDTERSDYVERRRAMFARFSRNLNSLLVCAHAYQMQGLKDRSDSLLDSLAPIEVTDSSHAMVLANMLENAGARESAIAVLEDPKWINDGRCRVLLIDLFARSGKTDQAIDLLSVDSADQDSSSAMAIAQAMVLAATGQQEALAAKLDEIQFDPSAMSLAMQLHMVSLNTSVDRFEKALELLENMPDAVFDQAEALSMKIDLLSRTGRVDRLEQAVESLFAGVGPADMLSVACRVLSEQYFIAGRLGDALKLMDRLAQSPDRLQVGVNWTEATFQTAVLLGRSGLYDESVNKCLEVVYRGRQGNTAGLLILGNALLDMGRKQQAIELLSLIDSSDPQYLQAKLRLIEMEKSSIRQMRQLDYLSRLAPVNETILLKRMELAAREDYLSAVRIYEDFKARQGDTLNISASTVLAASMLLEQDGKYEKAFALASQGYTKSPSPQKALNAAVLSSRTDPQAGAAMLEENFGDSLDKRFISDRAIVLARAAAVSLSVLADNHDQATIWHNRMLETISQMQPEAAAELLKLQSLSFIAAGGSDYSVFDGLGIEGFGPSAASDISKHKDAKQIAQLLLSVVANEMGQDELAFLLSMDLLKSNPKLRWAAAIATANAPDMQTLEKVAVLLDGNDTLAHTIVKAQIEAANEHYLDAANLVMPLLDEIDDATLTVSASLWYHLAGNREKAIALALKAWEKYSITTAANNCAYFMISGQQPGGEVLEKAHQLALSAMEQIPDDANLLDTLSWIEYLKGDFNSARTHAAKSVLAQPYSFASQYHMAMIDMALGDKDIARRRLSAIISRQDENIGGSNAEYIQLASEQLKLMVE